MKKEDLFQRLPSFARWVAVQAEGHRIRSRRYNAYFYQRLFELEADVPEEVRRAALEVRCVDFVRRAIAAVPTYRAYGISPEEIRTLTDVQKLPLLPKATVRASPHLYYAPEPRSANWRVRNSHTSGTTGAGLVFPVTCAAENEQWAVWWRYRRWHGLSLQTPCLVFGGRSFVLLRQREPPFWVTNHPGRQMLFSAYHLNEQTALSYLEALRRSNYPWLHGYPSILNTLAEFALKLGVELKAIRWVTVGAENLLEHQVRTIERAFGVRPRQHYGMAEGVANVSECPLGRLHVDEDYSLVEWVPDENGRFQIVGTNFTNPAFPLLRYVVGDNATPSSESACPCGRLGRLVQSLDGRQEDYVITKSGVKLGRLDHIFKDLVRIAGAQIIQENQGIMRVLVIKGDGFSPEDETALRQEIQKRTGNDLEARIEYVSEIRQTISGKTRFVINKLEAGQISRQGS
jgi:phenylacetate-CoA ligase